MDTPAAAPLERPCCAADAEVDVMVGVTVCDCDPVAVVDEVVVTVPVGDGVKDSVADAVAVVEAALQVMIPPEVHTSRGIHVSVAGAPMQAAFENDCAPAADALHNTLHGEWRAYRGRCTWRQTTGKRASAVTRRRGAQ